MPTQQPVEVQCDTCWNPLSLLINRLFLRVFALVSHVIIAACLIGLQGLSDTGKTAEENKVIDIAKDNDAYFMICLAIIGGFVTMCWLILYTTYWNTSNAVIFKCRGSNMEDYECNSATWELIFDAVLGSMILLAFFLSVKSSACRGTKTDIQFGRSCSLLNSALAFDFLSGLCYGILVFLDIKKRCFAPTAPYSSSTSHAITTGVTSDSHGRSRTTNGSMPMATPTPKPQTQQQSKSSWFDRLKSSSTTTPSASSPPLPPRSSAPTPAPMHEPPTPMKPQRPENSAPLKGAWPPRYEDIS